MKATRKSRFSLGMKIACILSCLTLFTMGFASWWIVKMPEAKTSTGSFEVYTVTNKNIDITLANATAPTIIFGKPDTSATWLVASNRVQAQSLSATIAFDVTVKDGETLSTETNVGDMLSKLSISLSVPDAAAMKTAITKNYLKTPTLTYQVGSETVQSVAYDVETGKFTSDISMATVNVNKVTVTLTLTFEWGSAFGGTNTNPYTYFNTLQYGEDTDVTGETKAANVAAKEVLEAIEDLKGDGAGLYTLNINATAKS
jgi:hypothetical protein